MGKIEFACDIRLIKDLLKYFGKEDISIIKLNAYTILVKMDVYTALFKRWAKPNMESITIISPSYLKGEMPRPRLTTTIKEGMEDIV